MMPPATRLDHAANAPSRRRSAGRRGATGKTSRGARGLCGFYVRFDAVGALRRAGNSQCNEFAVFPRNGAVLTANDLIQAQPGVEFCGREFAHVLEKP